VTPSSSSSRMQSRRREEPHTYAHTRPHIYTYVRAHSDTAAREAPLHATRVLLQAEDKDETLRKRLLSQHEAVYQKLEALREKLKPDIKLMNHAIKLMNHAATPKE
jgi:hypothetical protein